MSAASPRLLHLTAATVDLGSGLIRQGGEESHLGGLELSLLQHLVDASPRVVSRDELQTAVWKTSTDVPTRAVDQAVRRLRKKLGEPGRSPRHLVGVYGEGYRFVPLPRRRDVGPAGTAPTAGNLLPSVGSFVGRDAELSELRAALQRGRGVVLVGPAGVGKSRLAREGAWRWREEYPDGLWVLDLDSVAGPEEAARRLDALWDGAARPAGEAALPFTLRALGASPRALLILDNAEDAPVFAADLLSVAGRVSPDLRVVVTSRISIETELGQLRVEGLPTADAVELLRSRALEAIPELDDGPLDTLAELLDGFPLGLELAAVRLRLLTTDEMVRRLQQGRRVLGRAPRGTLRFASIDAAILSSWEGLAPHTQDALRTLAAFGGTLSHAAAEHLLSTFVPGHDPLDLLDALLDQSLVQVTGTRPRRLLVYRSVREFIEGRDAPGEGEERRLAVARSLGVWGGSTVHQLMGPEQDHIAATMALDLPFIEHACVWTLQRDADSAVQLLHAIVEYAWLTGVTRAAERLTALALTERVRSPLAATDIKLIRAVVLVLVLRNDEAEDLLRSIDYGPEFSWRRGSWAYLLANCQSINDPRAALDTVDEALDGMQLDRLQMRVAQARLLSLRARLRSLMADADVVLADLKAARRAWGNIGSPSGEGSAYVFQGWFECKQRRTREALASLQRAQELLSGVGGHRHRHLASSVLALIQADLGNVDAALSAVGAPPPAGQHADLATLHHYTRGLIQVQAGDLGEAEAGLDRLQRLLGDDAHPFYSAHAAALQAQIGLARGDRAEVLRACALARGCLSTGALSTAAGLIGGPLLMIATEADDVRGAEPLLRALERAFTAASDLRVLTAFVPVRAALEYARGRQASPSAARQHRQAARALLREGRRRGDVHRGAALACLDARLSLARLEASVTADGELKAPPASALAEDTRREVQAWVELLGES